MYMCAYCIASSRCSNSIVRAGFVLHVTHFVKQLTQTQPRLKLKHAHISVMLIYLNYNLREYNHIAILCLAYLKIMTLLQIT